VHSVGYLCYWRIEFHLSFGWTFWWFYSVLGQGLRCCLGPPYSACFFLSPPDAPKFLFNAALQTFSKFCHNNLPNVNIEIQPYAVTFQFLSCDAFSKPSIYHDCVIEFSNPCSALNVLLSNGKVVRSGNVQSRKMFPCKIGDVSQHHSLSLICASNVSSLCFVLEVKFYNHLNRIFEFTRYDVWICHMALVVAFDGNTSDRNRPKGRCVQRYIYFNSSLFMSENGNRSASAFKKVTF
jgi:hypothetical protein